ncbi:Peptide deformylase 1B, chloroplastic [Sesamum angolense]|uniref:Peptide deformylase n=1 Tax=Sesamum angolense TaxID=2727404 RepID=A0AAE1XDH2_9LAMI|nr:Peptide deformylase 1B, chloroplastic [Sesamum angolense]
MACATCVRSTALTRTLVPCLRRGPPLGHSTFRRIHRFNSAGFFTLSSNSLKHLVPPVFAQARRSFSSMAKEEAIASPAELQFEERLEIVQSVFFTLRMSTDGIGLSAPQVGINVQLMVFNSVGERGEGEEIVLVNPRISRYSRKIVPYNEGCLSFPGIYADVERPDSLKVDAQDITGARFEVNLTGLPARVFQHEYDHLQGILFFDRMSDEVLETIRAELQGLEKKYEKRTGKPSPEKIDARRRRKKAIGFGKS